MTDPSRPLHSKLDFTPQADYDIHLYQDPHILGMLLGISNLPELSQIYSAIRMKKERFNLLVSSGIDRKCDFT